MKFGTATSETAKHKTSELFAEIQKICSAREIQGVNFGADATNCTITNDLVSLTIEANALNWELSVSELDCRVLIPGEPISGYRFPREALVKACFVPDWPSGCTFGWREKGRTARPFLSVAELAEKCVSQFIALEQGDKNGQIKHEWKGYAHPSRS
jgi:hypothetical protein